MAVKESHELPEIRRRRVVVHRAEISVVRDIQRVHAQPDVMRLAPAIAEKGQAELPIQLQVQ